MWALATGIGAFIQHDQVIAHHFGSKLLVAFLVFPATCAKTTLDIYEASFMQVFLSQLRQAAP